MPQAVEAYVRGDNFSKIDQVKRQIINLYEEDFKKIDSKTVLPCYNSTDPGASLADTKDFDSYKLYLSDTGLFVTLMFIDRPETENDVYAKLLSDKLPANLGYLYENLVAQMITASGRELYYHTWEKEGSTHYYEVDFLMNKNPRKHEWYSDPQNTVTAGLGLTLSATDMARLGQMCLEGGRF